MRTICHRRQREDVAQPEVAGVVVVVRLLQSEQCVTNQEETDVVVRLLQSEQCVTNQEETDVVVRLLQSEQCVHKKDDD